jgi:hypothetical protein
MAIHKESCCDQAIPTNAARPFKHPAEVLRKKKVVEILEKHQGGTVLEIGGGGLRNSRYLQELGFEVHVLEVKGIEERFEEIYQDFRNKGGVVHYSFPKTRKFNLIVSTFVIETVCRVNEREQILGNSYQQLRMDGAFVLSVRGPVDLVTATVAGHRCTDGYTTPNKTFARSFTRAQLKKLLSATGFEYVEFLHKEATREPEYLHAVASKRSL